MSADAATTTKFGHVDVLVVGAGISGIGMACHLKRKQPDRTFAIVDSRDSIGGTWDLFRYPGIRSDSDLHTFGFEFKPWTRDNAIANGDEILDYLHETVAENDLARHLHLGHKVVRADFSSDQARWIVTLERASDGEQFDVTCGVLFSGAGYYDYARGHTPHFEGREDFRGQIVHPQLWPEDLDYTGKKVVIIGSGATAVTLLPALAEKAGHVTMLQRSPGYIMPIPRKDPIANSLRRLLPSPVAYRITRRININRMKLLYNLSQRFPKQMRRLIRRLNTMVLPKGYEVDTHFNPHYGPWDQRLCVVPDADMFKAISSGDASVVTDRIVRFTEGGILLASGEELAADIIVTATGFSILPFGGIALEVDGEPVDLPSRMVYKTMMVSGVPNFAFAMGYLNYSWTLKVDLVAEYLCRLLVHMDSHGYATVTPHVDDPTLTRRPFLDMESGWVGRSKDLYPQQGSHGPWTVDQSYAPDRDRLTKAPIEDPALKFTAGRGRLAVTGRTTTPTMIAVQGRPTRVRIVGDPANPPLLLLHGIGRSLEDWAPQYARLADTHRVIALDLPGSGFSARVPEPTTLEVLARGVLETLDTLGERRPLHVVGNSLGGAVAMQLLALDPGRVASLVLVDSAGFGAKVALPLRLLALPVFGELMTRRTTRGGARMAERLIFTDRTLATGARIEHAMDIAGQPDTGTVVLETTRALATVRGIKPEWRAQLAAAVTKHPRPTLVIWGDRDRIVPAANLETAHRVFPHAETQLFTGVGHMPQLECPDDFAARVLAFLADAEPMPAAKGRHDDARQEELDGQH
ncbi:alpha/beta fold hydrolase [Streptomyces sp. NPDC058457]|uniref:alpha/beta fold hydrolase n=1 Tax=Streptomyces sp. NPDC058457 TaxID=3346507 RepID=UPI00366231CC